MEKLYTQKHTKDSLYYAISIMLERASYYGLRALIVLYMTGDILKMSNYETLNIYGLIAGSLVFGQIIGALLGDLLLGNKKAIIIGAILHAVGAFSLCIPSLTGLYLGLFLIVLGSGFFAPNITSNFGKLYLNKPKLIDAGFTLYYLIINLGAFFGIILIGYLGETIGFNVGFITAGILMLLSILPVLLSKEEVHIRLKKTLFSVSKKVLTISIAFLLVGLFWGIYKIAGTRIFDLHVQFRKLPSLTVPVSFLSAINSYFTIVGCLIIAIIWTYFYNSQFFKILLGFIFGVLSYGILLLIPEIPTEQHLFIYIASMFFIALSEVLIALTIFGVLLQYSNPKYLAILISLMFIPTRLIALLFGLFENHFEENSMLGLQFSIVAMSIIALALMGYLLWNKKSNTYELEQ
ncbi:MFS transporter [Tenacibaculum aiptasiae]|uniref:POT-type proton-dependent oligopeptide transporter n=1 Tax=Tenacibaculum aiptasiae TaxID=426481 RepID=UPI003B5AED92